MKNYGVLILRGTPDQIALAASVAANLPVTGLLEEENALSLYFNEGTDVDEMLAELKRAPDLAELEAERGVIAEQNWNAEFEASLKPVTITDRVIVAQSWNRHEVEPREDQIVVTIDPKMSFGTGHHETTRLVARLMEPIELEGRSVLDAGTGTGILSIIAALGGAAPIVAFDVDDWAVENTRENLEQNRVSDRVEVILGDMDDVGPGQFDLILANIQSFVIIPLLPTFAGRMSGEEARLITSGVLIEDQDDLYSAARAAGLTPLEEDTENEWLGTTFLLS